VDRTVSPGHLLGQCAQYCASQHAKMLLRVSIDSPENFDAWVHAQRQTAIQDERAIAGQAGF
jgi:cytochrome c oxidase subunit II